MVLQRSTDEIQIHYVLVRDRWASSVLDCRAYRGADTGSANNFDHVLLRATLRLRLKTNRACQRPDRFDVSKLKTAAGAEFRSELRNQCEALSQYPDPNPEMEWTALNAVARDWRSCILAKHDADARTG